MISDQLMKTYARIDLSFERGEGSWLITEEGRRMLDFGSGIAVNVLGHAHPHLVKELSGQVSKLWHCSNLYRIRSQEKLAYRLVDLCFADSVFFCNSGAEAVETAIKVSRRYHQSSKTNSKRYRIVVTANAFHGRTLATISAGGQSKHLDGFLTVVDGFDRVSYGDIDEAIKAITSETAAILVEPIQGEGGLSSATDQYLSRLREVSLKENVLLIYDEVQTGIGRTGDLFAYQQSGVAPDIICLAKALGGGFPVGACLASHNVSKYMVPGTHGSTFGGNPLAMTAANAVLDIILEKEFLKKVKLASQRLTNGLDNLVVDFPEVFSGWRGRGLMLGLECLVPNSELVSLLIEHDLLTVVAGDNVIRLLPPLNVSNEEIDIALSNLRTVAQILEDKNG